jgi:hypothetical protein
LNQTRAKLNIINAIPACVLAAGIPSAKIASLSSSSSQQGQLPVQPPAALPLQHHTVQTLLPSMKLLNMDLLHMDLLYMGLLHTDLSHKNLPLAVQLCMKQPLAVHL